MTQQTERQRTILWYTGEKLEVQYSHSYESLSTVACKTAIHTVCTIEKVNIFKLNQPSGLAVLLHWITLMKSDIKPQLMSC